MPYRIAGLAVSLALAATAAEADFEKIESHSDFVRAVDGKTLTRPMISLQVLPDGRIQGRGLLRDVTGEWSWQNGYFCRDLNWGDEALGYNCQEVRINEKSIRFTSDRGAGDYADFRLK